MSHLPLPTLDAQTHSARLTQFIKQRIQDQGGWMSFADFMQVALYEPGLGYYVAGARKFGAEGDFVTAPEISSAFSQCIARQCVQIFSSLESDLSQDLISILEFGAGTGMMAADILLELEKQHCLPEKYFILEVSPDLQQRQHETLQKKCAHLLSRVEWLSKLPENFVGVVLANEVLDAMPVHLFEMHAGKMFEKGIKLNEHQEFEWKLGAEINEPLLEKKHKSNAEKSPKQKALPRDVRTMDGKEREDKDVCSRGMPFVSGELPIENENYTSEICFALKPWLKNLYDTMKQGVVLLIDYGFPAHEYYHPDRDQGTLMCHYRHHAHTDPFLHIGLQDITAHVDFTAVTNAAKQAGFLLSGYTNQANFLMALDILNSELLKNMNVKERYQHAQAIKKLLLPSEMGELFKVIALSKGIDMFLQGFSLKNDIERLSNF